MILFFVKDGELCDRNEIFSFQAGERYFCRSVKETVLNCFEIIVSLPEELLTVLLPFVIIGTVIRKEFLYEALLFDPFYSKIAPRVVSFVPVSDRFYLCYVDGLADNAGDQRAVYRVLLP